MERNKEFSFFLVFVGKPRRVNFLYEAARNSFYVQWSATVDVCKFIDGAVLLRIP